MGNIMHGQAGKSADVLAHVARNLRTLRLAAGLSQQQVAERAGLSRRMIVGLEGGDTNISLAKLARVAEALGVGFARLVQPPEPDAGDGARPTLWRGAAAESRAALLGTVRCSREAEFWEWSIASGDRYEAEPDPAGWHEAVFVVEGTLTLCLGAAEKVVPAGGFTSYPSDRAYAYANRGSGVLRFLRAVLG
jgi:transcriptional regulator with XRE-family HTH domain